MSEASAANTLRLDPSRTLMLRRVLITETNRRYADLRRAIVTEATKGPSRAWNGLDAADVLRSFRTWLDTQLSSTILAGSWWLPSISETYRRGLVRAFQDVRPAGWQSVEDFLRLMEMVGRRGLTGTAGGTGFALNAARRTPQYRGHGGRFVTEKVHLLAERFKQELAGATDAFAQKAARVVSDALAGGWSQQRLAKELADQLDISLSRARTIARNELHRAFVEGQIDALEEMEVEEVELEAEWVTMIGACPLCAPRNGMTMPIAQARGLIPFHVGCRCIWRPTVKIKPALPRSSRAGVRRTAP